MTATEARSADDAAGPRRRRCRSAADAMAVPPAAIAQLTVPADAGRGDRSALRPCPVAVAMPTSRRAPPCRPQPRPRPARRYPVASANRVGADRPGQRPTAAVPAPQPPQPTDTAAPTPPPAATPAAAPSAAATRRSRPLPRRPRRPRLRGPATQPAVAPRGARVSANAGGAGRISAISRRRHAGEAGRKDIGSAAANLPANHSAAPRGQPAHRPPRPRPPRRSQPRAPQQRTRHAPSAAAATPTASRTANAEPAAQPVPAEGRAKTAARHRDAAGARRTGGRAPRRTRIARAADRASGTDRRCQPGNVPMATARTPRILPRPRPSRGRSHASPAAPRKRARSSPPMRAPVAGRRARGRDRGARARRHEPLRDPARPAGARPHRRAPSRRPRRQRVVAPDRRALRDARSVAPRRACARARAPEGRPQDRRAGTRILAARPDGGPRQQRSRERLTQNRLVIADDEAQPVAAASEPIRTPHSGSAPASTSAFKELNHGRLTAITPTPIRTPPRRCGTRGHVARPWRANFEQFLKLLTTQLKNQNPLDPLDTNQFTQQLVQFAQVEQQINMNQPLTTLIALQQTTQTTQAIGLVGATVTVGGDTADLSNGIASWSFSPAKTAPATITIKDATGQTAYSGSYTVSPGSRTSPGTARATTAPSGRTASTRSRSSPRIRPGSRLRCRPRSPASSTAST